MAFSWMDRYARRAADAGGQARSRRELARARQQPQPFGRLLSPEEVGNLAVFLLSDVAGPMTGGLIDQNQRVVGGFG